MYVVYDLVDQRSGPGESAGPVRAPSGFYGHQGGSACEDWLAIDKVSWGAAGPHASRHWAGSVVRGSMEARLFEAEPKTDTSSFSSKLF